MAFFLSKRVVRRITNADQEKQIVDEQIVETGKLASIGELAAGIAHEINNPVAIMVEEAGWIGDLLQEEEFKKSENLDEFKRALAQINTQGKRCKEITSKLLTFARKTDSRSTSTNCSKKWFPCRASGPSTVTCPSRRTLRREFPRSGFPSRNYSRFFSTLSIIPWMPWRSGEESSALERGVMKTKSSSK
jgi:hypothetical protein